MRLDRPSFSSAVVGCSANQAIEDAVVLAQCLKEEGLTNVEAALAKSVVASHPPTSPTGPPSRPPLYHSGICGVVCIV